MKFSVLHISDLHRDLNDEVDNPCLLDSLARDFGQYGAQDPSILKPSLCIVTGDLVCGVDPTGEDTAQELNRQYAQAEEFLVGLTDQFFSGDRARIVILPGNHDVCYDDVMQSAQRIEVPTEAAKKAALVAELRMPRSRLRWSWREMCFFRITDEERYRKRFSHFATTYASFYQGQRTFSFVPEQQFGLFDFPDLGFCVLTLNSCYDNDPMRSAGAVNPTALTDACRALRDTKRAGWLTAAAWHHNIVGRPVQGDFLDAEFLQLLIDSGVSLGFHGHQHLTECCDERYRLGPSPRKMTIISASTLCAEPHNLRPGVPRSYNVVELDTDAWRGHLHQRHMVNTLLNLPVWGPGHFNITNKSFVDFEMCKPLVARPAQLDTQLALDRADKLLGCRQWSEAADVLGELEDVPLKRPLLVKALAELGDARRTITALWPPQSTGEAVMVGGAILDKGTREEVEAFIRLGFVSGSTDASVREVVRRIHERRVK